MRFIETAFLVIHAGYEGGDIAEKKNNPRFFCNDRYHHDPHESLKRHLSVYILALSFNKEIN